MSQKTPKLAGLDKENTPRQVNRSYSRFVKLLQITLPLIALVIIVVVFLIGSDEEQNITAIPEAEITPQIAQSVGKNELITPKFESVDDKGQPFTITAEKAIQENADGSGGMLLEKPKGTLMLNNGQTVGLAADQGVYLQDGGFLELTENVVLTHSDGYRMDTNLLNVDTSDNRSWTDQNVNIVSQDAMITGAGLEASSTNQTLIIQGPAKAILYFEDNQGGLPL